MSVVPIRKDFRNLQPEDIAPLFLMFKRASGISQRTLLDYKRALALFFSRFPDGLDFPRERTQEFLGAYENPCSFNVYFAYLKTFWDWTIAEGYFRGDRHPLAGLKKRRPRGRIVQLTEGEVSRLLEQPDRKTFCGLRDYAGILLAVDTGIRPGEMLALLPEDFQPARGEIVIRAEYAKTRTGRTLPISTPTLEAITRLLAVRPAEWGSAPIFCSQDGGQYHVQPWTKRVAAYGEKCGLKISAYHLRHAAALLFLRRGGGAFALQNLLGHSTMTMTRTYVNLTQEDTRREHAAAGVILHLVGEKEIPKKRLGKL